LVGNFSRFDFLRLADLDELEVPLVLESDEDANSILRFKLCCDGVAFGTGFKERFAGASPTRVLMFRPASSSQPTTEELVDVRSVMVIVSDVVGAEVVLKDVK
jgi:hypothetical protein